MAASDLFDIPTIVRLQQLVANFRSGGLLLPDFQRPFVWRDEQRLQLFDSILKGLPIGSLLIWRTTRTVATKRSMEGFELPAGPSAEHSRNYLLDGQQRVFTLFAALSATQTDRIIQDGERRWPIYLDLEADRSPENGETRLRLARRDTLPPVTWLPLSVVLDSRRLFAHQRALEKEKKFDLVERVEEVANILRDYPVALVPILTNDLNLVTQSFQRINSAGSLMSEAHMLRALTYSDHFDFSDRIQRIAAELPGAWSQLSEQLYVNTLKAILGLSIYRAEMPELKEAIEKFPAILDQVGHGVTSAARFACTHLKVLGPHALPYAYQFVALAYAAANEVDLDVHADALARWFWATTYVEFFTGMTAGQLRAAFEHVKRVGAGGPALPEELSLSCFPLNTFRIPAVRSLVLMHRLAALQGEAGPALLARGSEAFGQLVQRGRADDPANRILVAPELAVETRRDLFDLAPRFDELRASHLFPSSEHSAWFAVRSSSLKKGAVKDSNLLADVLRWRRERLFQLDEKFVRSLGLTLEA